MKDDPLFAGFFPNKQTKRGATISKKDLELARMLLAAIEHHQLLTARPRITTWAQFISSLRKTVSYDRIKQTIAWYHHLRILPRYIPAVHSARSFCKAFVKIERVMNESSMPIVAVNDLSGKQQRLYYQLIQNYFWPNVVRDDLPGSIQRNWINFRSFHRRINDLCNHISDESDYGSFLRYARSHLQSCPVEYFNGWYVEKWHRFNSSRWWYKPAYIIWTAGSVEYELQSFEQLRYWGATYNQSWTRLMRDVSA